MLRGEGRWRKCPGGTVVLGLVLVVLAVVPACGLNGPGGREGSAGELPDLESTAGNAQGNPASKTKRSPYINPDGKTIGERFLVPEGFTRIPVAAGSFAEYLRNLPLKPDGAEVRYYDGKTKPNRNVYDAVLDVDIGNRDLQQCADAVMRLRAEYLYGKGRFAEISFNFANGFRADYRKWMDGYRVVVKDNQSHWVKRAAPSNTYQDFRRYLDIVFAYANTASLAKQTRPVAVAEMEIGDFFVDRGHAAIVVDMAENEETGAKLFLLAQSYMPAQEIQILRNPMNDRLSPWYELNFGERLYTPEWIFTNRDLHRFP